MKTKSLNILMVDDHPMILESYVEVLKSMEKHSNIYKFQIERAFTILQTVEILKRSGGNKQFHLVLLDISLPNEGSLEYASGLDLGYFIRKDHPETKIIVITSYDTYPLFQKLLDVIKPEGILIKSELSPQGLNSALLDVLGGIPHYTKTVQKFLTRVQIKPNVLDHYDMLILFHLSEGKLTKNLTDYLPLSLRSIERRKTRLKDILKLEHESSDVQLLNRAKEEGYL